MIKKLLVFLLAHFCISQYVIGQDELERDVQSDSSRNKMPNTFYFSASKDNFFDFYTYAIGSIGISKNKSFTCFALLRGVQFGAGVSFLTYKSRFLITPFLSVLNGKYQSGSSRPLLGETFAPGVASTYNSKKEYFDQGLIYYKHIREKSELNFDALLYWVTVAYKLSPKVYLGIHNESTFQTKNSIGNREVYYFWLGSYVQINILKSADFKFISGWDSKNGDFARATFGFWVK